MIVKILKLIKRLIALILKIFFNIGGKKNGNHSN